MKGRLLRYQRRTFPATFAAVLAGRLAVLAAQEPPGATPESGPLEEVLVTGSRLPSPAGASISPVTSVSASEISATGLTRVEDVLNALPMVFANMTSNVSNGADGTAAVNLRGLGDQRTLVLVDGLRLGPGSADGRNWSDVNQIPTAMVARIDVLTGGTSAVYGADAVAGVVNFVMNQNFEGVRLDAGDHFYEHDNSGQDGVAQLVSAAGDQLPPSRVDTGFGKNAALLVGSDFAGHTANATAYLTYDNQAAVLQSQYDYSACQVSLLPATGPPYTGLGCGGSGVAAGGQFVAFGSSGAAALLDDTVDTRSGVLRPYTTRDAYNFQPENYYLTPNVRWTAGFFVHTELGAHVEAYANLMYMRNSMSAQIAPGGDFYGLAFIPCADPLLTAQEVATLCTAGNLAASNGSYEIYGGKDYPGLNMQIGRRNVEGGGRTEVFVNEMLRGVVGAKGTLGGPWSYDVHAQRGTTETHDSIDNDFGTLPLEQALNVLPGPSGPVCGGATGLAAPLVGAGTAYIANPKCVPWNIWVPGGVTATALESLYVPLQISGSVTEQVVSGSTTAELGRYGLKVPLAQLGLQVSLGAEWRQEQSAYLPNQALQQGDVAGGGAPLLPVAGEFTVREGFVETRLPLAAHRAFAEDLWIDGGLRYSSYSNGFVANTYKLGFVWAPLREVSLRGSYQRAVRAPDVGELFAPQAISGDGSTDPCEGSTPTASLTACELSGVKKAQYGHILVSPTGIYNGLQGGNPQLRPEAADTYTIGLVVQEQANLQASIDYFDIRISGVVGVIGADTILLNCLASVDNPQQAARFCPLIHRDAEGTLWLSAQGYVSDLEVNEGALSTAGVDAHLSYRLPLNAGGSLLLSLSGTRLLNLETAPLAGSGSYDCAGYFGTTCGVAPRWRHVLDVTWSAPWNDFQLGARWSYLAGIESELSSSSPFLAGAVYAPLSHIPAYSYFDLTAAIGIGKNVTLRLGANNVLDKAPPLIVTGADCDGVYCNGNTFGGTYRSLGRYLFAQVAARFGRD
jgi:iron complex outermembrane receptor protein